MPIPTKFKVLSIGHDQDIDVHTYEGERIKFHIQDNGALIVSDSGHHLAAYAPGKWQTATPVDDR